MQFVSERFPSPTLPTALTAPPPRPRAMPEQEIVIWTPKLFFARLISVTASFAMSFAEKPASIAVRDKA